MHVLAESGLPLAGVHRCPQDPRALANETAFGLGRIAATHRDASQAWDRCLPFLGHYRG